MSSPKELLDALASKREADVTGLAGAARGWIAKDLIGPGRARLLLAITAGEDEAEDLARDLAFFLPPGRGSRSPVLRVPADPVLPYDDLSPDRGLEMERLAALE